MFVNDGVMCTLNACRYEELTSKKLLGKRKSGRGSNGGLGGDGLECAGEGESLKPAPSKKRHVELQKRLDKMDKRGFMKPS